MRNFFRKTISHPLRVFGGTLLWGLVEFIALQKSRRSTRSKQVLLAK
jgi:hypothetical protein